MRLLVRRAAPFIAAIPLTLPGLALAQTAPATPTAQSVLTESGVDLTQLPTAVGLGAAAVLGVALAMSVVMIIRKMARASR